MSPSQQAPTAAPAGRPSGDSEQYLTFSTGGEVFAIGILNIKEINEYGNLTTIPMMPSFIHGVINLRGSVVPVIDLSVRFGRAPTRIARRSSIIVIEVRDEAGARHDIGVLVDAVHAVLEIAETDIEPPPMFGARIRTDFIHGMGKVADKFIILLTVDKVLSVDEMAQLTVAGKDHAEAPPPLASAP